MMAYVPAANAYRVLSDDNAEEKRCLSERSCVTVAQRATAPFVVCSTPDSHTARMQQANKMAEPTPLRSSV